jgi:DNA-binding XRE family transcriptional regulator
MAKAEWFAGRLRELREGAGLTQGQLADKAGLTREGVAQLETGRRKPAWETVVALCEALACGCEAFLQEPASAPGPRRGRPRKGPPGGGAGAAGAARPAPLAGTKPPRRPVAGGETPKRGGKPKKK